LQTYFPLDFLPQFSATMSSLTGIHSYILMTAVPPSERQHQLVLNWPWPY